MAYVIPPAWAVNQQVVLAKLNAIVGDLTFLGAPPCGQADSGASSQAITSGSSFTQITTMSSVFVAGSVTWTSNHFVVPVAGRYYASAAVDYPGSVIGGSYQAQIWQNSAPQATGVKPGLFFSAGAPVISAVRYLLICAAGDTVSLWTSQNGGSTKNASGRLFVKWISN